jgi:hypothetical protein
LTTIQDEESGAKQLDKTLDSVDDGSDDELNLAISP